jgi:hypothetical protein
MQRGKGELHLGLDTGRTRHAAVRRSPGQVVQQRGFSNSWFAVDNQRLAFAGADSFDKLIENRTFSSSAD